MFFYTLKPCNMLIHSTVHYPFGMPVPGRVKSSPSGGYRFGFGGHEKDDEVHGGWYAFGDYGYDSRLGRRPTPDPVDQVSISNYATFANNPILLIDPDGRDARVVVHGNKITIQANIILYSQSGTLSSTTAANIQKQIIDNWYKDSNGNSWTYTKDGNTYEVNFDINISVGNSNLSNEANRNYDGKNNYIEIVGGDDYTFRSHTDNCHAGEWAAGTTQAYHEFAHIVGLQDRYQGKTPDSGYEGNVMGQYGGKVEQKNIDAILEKPVEKTLRHLNTLVNYVPKTLQNTSENYVPEPFFLNFGLMVKRNDENAVIY